MLRLEAETRRAREESAVLAERGRIARELHDVLAHTLSGLAVQLEGARLLAEHTHADPRLVEQVSNAQDLARSGMAGAKRAVATLRGEALPGPDQIPELVEHARLATGAPVTYRVDGEPGALAPELGLPLYRAVQEALANVAKHASGAAHRGHGHLGSRRRHRRGHRPRRHPHRAAVGRVRPDRPGRARGPGRRPPRGRAARRRLAGAPDHAQSQAGRCTDERAPPRCGSSSSTTRRWSATGSP